CPTSLRSYCVLRDGAGRWIVARGCAPCIARQALSGHCHATRNTQHATHLLYASLWTLSRSARMLSRLPGFWTKLRMALKKAVFICAGIRSEASKRTDLALVRAWAICLDNWSG